jgi:hypothetical protein
VVVDLGGDFMDSAILRALLSAREQALARREGSFAVFAPDGFPSRLLGHVGALVPTCPDLASAAAAVAPGG